MSARRRASRHRRASWRGRMTWRGAVGLLVTGSLALSGCGAGSSAGDPPQVPPVDSVPPTGAWTVPPDGVLTADPASDPDFSRYYEQELDWESCAEEMRCADVAVPLDYTDPSGERLEIRVIDSGSAGGFEDSGEPPPHLLVNPGGPGASGYDLVAEQLGWSVGEEVREAYDVVGFDPRGVHRSAPVDCLSDEELDEIREATTQGAPDTLEEIEDAQQEAGDSAQRCAERTGELLGHVDTASAARDMDIIRAALGDDRLHYLGFSYGTRLGLSYAEQFSLRTGRFVLDGMVDTSLGAEELAVEQTRAFEDALEDFAAWCVEQEDCAVQGEPEDVVDAVRGLFDEVAADPGVGPDGRAVPVEMLVAGFIQPLYVLGGHTELNRALTMALESGDLRIFQRWADRAAGRGPEGEYRWNSAALARAVQCLDYEPAEDPEQILAQQRELEEASPTFGPYRGAGGISCTGWPVEAPGEPHEPQLDAVEDMLFIGTTGDPATPVEWAERMHEQIPGSSLLIDEGIGHLAYRPSNACVADAVAAHLVAGDLFTGRRDC